MREHGLDVAGHRARQLAQPGASDLVIGLTREHVREAVVMEPTLLPSAFTLKELARRAAAAGPRPTTTSLSRMARRPSPTGRALDELLGDSPVDDFRDPIGQPIRVYRQAAGELAQLSDEVVRLLWPSLPGECRGGVVGRDPTAHGVSSDANWATLQPLSRRTRWTKNVLSSIITSTSASCAVGGRSSSSCACSPPASRSHVPRRAPGSTRRRRPCWCPIPQSANADGSSSNQVDLPTEIQLIYSGPIQAEVNKKLGADGREGVGPDRHPGRRARR